MRGIYTGDETDIDLVIGREYKVIGYEGHGEFLRVVDESGGDYLYDAESFEIKTSCMKGIWRGEDDELGLRYGKEYELLGYEWDGTMISVVDETGDDYLYDADCFEITETAYPVVLSRGKNHIIVFVPDFSINTQGKDTEDALSMARDAICLMCVDMQDEGESLPVPTPLHKVRTENLNDLVALVDVNIAEYRQKLVSDDK